MPLNKICYKIRLKVELNNKFQIIIKDNLMITYNKIITSFSKTFKVKSYFKQRSLKFEKDAHVLRPNGRLLISGSCFQNLGKLHELNGLLSCV